PVEVIVVGVPAIGLHLDECDAVLDQAPSQQTAVAEACAAIAVADGILLFFQLKRFQPRTEDQLRGTGVEDPMVSHAPLTAGFGKVLFELFEQLDAPTKAAGIDTLGQLHMLGPILSRLYPSGETRASRGAW